MSSSKKKIVMDVPPATVVSDSPADASRLLAGEPVAVVNGVEVPTVEQVKAAGYTDEAAAKISAEQRVRAKAASGVSPKYRVTANCGASFFGQAIKLRKDDVIDSAGYGGVAGIARLIDSGAKIEEIK
jgi:hypothetical protein